MTNDFFRTHMGKAYYEHHIPNIMRNTENIANEFKRANNLKEKELALKKEEIVLLGRTLELQKLVAKKNKVELKDNK